MAHLIGPMTIINLDYQRAYHLIHNLAVFNALKKYVSHDNYINITEKTRGGALGYSRYSRIPTFFQTIFNAFNMFQNPNPDKILFLSR